MICNHITFPAAVYSIQPEILFHHIPVKWQEYLPSAILEALLLLPYLPTHLGSNSGSLLNTHRQLCSILWCSSWFHCKKQVIPQHRLSYCAPTETCSVLFQVGYNHTTGLRRATGPWTWGTALFFTVVQQFIGWAIVHSADILNNLNPCVFEIKAFYNKIVFFLVDHTDI